MFHPLSKGFFITLEGGEGAGKSSLLELLATHLRNNGYEVVTTREPGGTQLGEAIRSLLLDKNGQYPICTQAELLLFLAARAQHIEELIRPALESNKVVLCDRFNDSTIAYQGAARQIDVKYVHRLCKMICGAVEPQVTLFLDVDPAVGLQRTQKLDKEQAQTGQFDRIESEKMEFHQRVQACFHKLARNEPFRIYRIDANKPQSYVFKEGVRAIDELLLLPSKRHS